jgi:ABC-type transporter Mla MlaB component
MKLEFQPPARLKVGGELNFTTVVVLEQQGIDLIGQHGPSADWTVDFSGVEAANSGGVAMLMSWKRHVMAQGGTLACVGVSADFLSLARLVHADELIDFEELVND